MADDYSKKGNYDVDASLGLKKLTVIACNPQLTTLQGPDPFEIVPSSPSPAKDETTEADSGLGLLKSLKSSPSSSLEPSMNSSCTNDEQEEKEESSLFKKVKMVAQETDEHKLASSPKNVSCNMELEPENLNKEIIIEKLVKMEKEMGEYKDEKIVGLKGNGDSIKSAIKIEVIDETAVVEPISACNFGNCCGKEKVFSCVGEAPEEYHKNGNQQEREREKENGRRTRGNGFKKLAGTNGKEHYVTEVENNFKTSEDEAKRTQREYDVTEAEKSCKRSGREYRRTYSRAMMEAMRFLNLEAQKKLWVQVYCGLGPAGVKEYDGLFPRNQKRHIQLDFDLRKQFQNVQTNAGILGGDCYQAIDNEIMNADLSYPDTECSEEASSDDDESILRPAFLVSGEPNFDSGPPQDGLEYLRRVRWEAAQIPKVKVAKLEKTKQKIEQTVYMPNIPDIAKCPEHLMPMKEWEDEFLADFSELRLAFSCIDDSSANLHPHLKFSSLCDDEESYTQLPENIIEKVDEIITKEAGSCEDPFNCPMPKSSFSDPKSSAIVDKDKGNPTLSVILNMDSVARLSMLRKRISSVENMSSLSKNDCLWLFALCAAIDTPPDADTCASLRCLLRKAASLRAEKTQMDDEVIMLNIMAVITGKYFGQSG